MTLSLHRTTSSSWAQKKKKEKWRPDTKFLQCLLSLHDKWWPLKVGKKRLKGNFVVLLLSRHSSSPCAWSHQAGTLHPKVLPAFGNSCYCLYEEINTKLLWKTFHFYVFFEHVKRNESSNDEAFFDASIDKSIFLVLQHLWAHLEIPLIKAPNWDIRNVTDLLSLIKQRLLLTEEQFHSICFWRPSTKRSPSSPLLLFKLSASPHSHFVSERGDGDKLNSLRLFMHLILGSDSSADFVPAIKRRGYLSFYLSQSRLWPHQPLWMCATAWEVWRAPCSAGGQETCVLTSRFSAVPKRPRHVEAVWASGSGLRC